MIDLGASQGKILSKISSYQYSKFFSLHATNDDYVEDND